MSEWLKNRFSLRVILLLQLKNIRWMHLSIRIANTIISCQITTPHFACGVTSLTSTVPVAWNHKTFTSSPWMDDSHVSWSITTSHMTKHGISPGGFSIHFMLAVASHVPKITPAWDLESWTLFRQEIKYSPQLFWILINIRVPRKPSMNLRNANCQLHISLEVPQDRQQHHQSHLSIVVSMWLLSDIGTFMVLVSPTTWSKDLLHYEIESIFVNHLLSPSNAASRLLVPAFWLEWDPVAARCIFRFAHLGYSWITTSIVSNCFCRDCFVAGCIKILLKPSNFEVPEAPASLLAGGDRSRTHFAQA